MFGLMQDQQLLISSQLEFAAQNQGQVEIVSRTVEGPIHRYTYKECAARSRQLAKALIALGVKEGDRMGTMAWNGYRHVELYFGVSGIGAICHTINPRLFLEQIIYIINHAEDSCLFVDLTFVPLLEELSAKITGVKHIVILTDRAHMPETSLPNVLCYEELLASVDDIFQWPQFDERTASSLCYTSGTTGNPKGVLYSHRSTVLHSYGVSLPAGIGYSPSDVIMPVVPMFHANGWGIIYVAAMCGAKLVLPGSQMDGKSIFELMDAEEVTVSAGVPTIWMMLINYMTENNKSFTSMDRLVIGGSAVSKSMIETFRNQFKIKVIHAWGMTETSPLGTSCILKHKHQDLSEEAINALSLKQGAAIFGVEMKIIDDENKSLPWDGKTFGRLMVRGPWIAAAYYKSEVPAVDENRWFDTGDVSTIDEDGFMQIVDRSKDVIKSGGEWISSIDVENEVVGCKGIAEAAVIAVADPKWGERPLVIAIKEAGAVVNKEDVFNHLKQSLAKWQLPDDILFVDELPHTATGKLLKTELREQYRNHVPKP